MKTYPEEFFTRTRGEVFTELTKFSDAEVVNAYKQLGAHRQRILDAKPFNGAAYLHIDEINEMFANLMVGRFVLSVEKKGGRKSK